MNLETLRSDINRKRKGYGSKNQPTLIELTCEVTVTPFHVSQKRRVDCGPLFPPSYRELLLEQDATVTRSTVLEKILRDFFFSAKLRLSSLRTAALPVYGSSCEQGVRVHVHVTIRIPWVVCTHGCLSQFLLSLSVNGLAFHNRT